MLWSPPAPRRGIGSLHLRLRPLPHWIRFVHAEDRVLLRRRWSKLHLGVCMAELSRVGGGSSPVLGVAGEGDAILGGDELPGPRREATGWATVEAALNRMSKWLVAGSFAIVALLKHDAEVMWILMGAVVNSVVAVTLKQLLNHERPAPAMRSDPGMPSSHAQSIFYAAMILVLSLFYWLRTNYLKVTLGVATLTMASYLSWLRVSQRLHTLNQVLVGAIVGSACATIWFALWHLFLWKAYDSSVWVRIVVILGSATFCVAFVIYAIHHWLKDEE